MAEKSAYWRDAVIAQVDTGTKYLALFTDDPTVDATGTEVTGGSYARQPISFAAPADGVLTSDTITIFTDMPATNVTHWGVYDAVTGGNMLYFGQFDLNISLNNLDDLPIASGDIVIRER